MRWLADESPIKLWDKSRRIGATYAQSYEDVRDCVRKTVPAVWFSSADESAAKEYIEYCEKWARMFHVAAESLGLVVIDNDKDIKALVIKLANGTRLHALSSNPKGFRSKGGKVVLDEFAHHDDPVKMWAAARPCITWGFPLRILSTQNGKTSLFYRFIQRILKKRLKWSLHTTPIETAVSEGLVDKILGHPTTEAERAEWLSELCESCADEDAWNQEYRCVAVDAATAFLTYDLIGTCEMEDALCDLEEVRGDLFVGVDIGRKKDLTVIWVLEKLGRVKYTRKIVILERTPFRLQREALYLILAHPNMRRACIDNTGIGMQLAEEAQEKFGRFLVEEVTFTGPVKESMAYAVRTEFEDRGITIPPDAKVREDLHSVKKITTAAGNIRFDVAAEEKTDSHADRFWALALANHADTRESGPLVVATAGKRASRELSSGY
jgi:phage FluMu gp28-like protein